MPYFYQSGKFLFYDIPHRPSVSGYSDRISGYDFPSDIVPKRQGPKQPTVEDIVKKGYFPVPRSEPETALISDKKYTAKLGLSDISVIAFLP
jgi:hypothetical protein